MKMFKSILKTIKNKGLVAHQRKIRRGGGGGFMSDWENGNLNCTYIEWTKIILYYKNTCQMSRIEA